MPQDGAEHLPLRQSAAHGQALQLPPLVVREALREAALLHPAQVRAHLPLGRLQALPTKKPADLLVWSIKNRQTLCRPNVAVSKSLWQAAVMQTAQVRDCVPQRRLPVVPKVWTQGVPVWKNEMGASMH